MVKKIITLVSIVLVIAGGIVFVAVMGGANWDWDKLDNEQNTEKFFSYAQSIEMPIEAITSISLDIGSMPVEIKKSGDDFTLTYFESERYSYQISASADGELFIKEKYSFKAKDAFTFFSIKRSKLKAVLTIPESYVSELSVKTTNTDLNFDGTDFEKLSVEAVNGALNIANSVIDSLWVKSVNFEVSVKNVTAKTAAIALTNGSVYASGNIDALDIGGTNLDIELQNLTSNTVKLSLVNGEVTAHNLALTKLSASSTNADFTIGLSVPLADFNITATTQNGDGARSQIVTGSEKHIVIDTLNGDINIYSAS